MTWWWGFQTKRFQRGASTRRSQLSVVATTVRLSGSSLLLYQNLGQCWLGSIRKAFSSKRDLSRCSVGSTILHLCWVRVAPEVNYEEGIYALLFTVVFWKPYNSFPYFSWFSQFNLYSFAQLIYWRLFLWMSLIKVLDTEIFPQHTIVDLNSFNTFIVLFSQEKPLRGKEIDTHAEGIKSCDFFTLL